MTNSMSRASRLRLMLVLLVSLVGCDQASKHYAVTHWKGQPGQSYLNDLFRIEYAENEGAFLSMFGTLSPTVRYAILVVGNGIGMTVLAVLLLGTAQIDRWSYVAWTLVFVGGVGNLPGTVVSAFGIGLADQSLQQILLNPVLGKITVLVAIILFLQWRPAGIFVTKSRSLEG